jgi:hypothetical protein
MDLGTSRQPACIHPRYIIKLAREGPGFNGIVMQGGLAQKFYWDYASEVPLVLKLNGRTDIPSDAEALSPRTQRLAARARRVGGPRRYLRRILDDYPVRWRDAAVVAYESMYANTRLIAEAIRVGLGNCTLVMLVCDVTLRCSNARTCSGSAGPRMCEA